MASINLQGDTSGSISISAPSVAGSNTLTLPATTQTLATQNSLGVRNLIINGDMRIAQRGTSLTSLTSGNNFTSDRFYFQVAAGTWSQTTDTDVPTGQGFVNSLKISCTATATPTGSQTINVSQGIEGLNLQHLKYGTSSAEQLTLSFWVKSNKTGTYLVWFYQNDDARQTNKTYTIDSADTWEKKTITISADTVGVIDNDNGQGMLVRWVLATGPDLSSGTSPDGTWEAYTGANAYAGQAVNLADSTSNYINITGVQLEVGTATPFEHRPYDMELARCQRYCYSMENINVAVVGHMRSTTEVGFAIPMPVSMRAAPSFSYSAVTGTLAQDGSSSSSGSSYNATPSDHSYMTAYLALGLGGSFTNNIGVKVRINHGTGNNYIWSAEL